METNAGYPSVFVVDRPQKDVSFVPPVRHSQRPRQYGQLLLRILVLLTLAGLVIQAYFLICFRKELDNATVQVGAEGAHERLVQGRKAAAEKPAAHLSGAFFLPDAGNHTVQWKHSAFLQGMSYKEGFLSCNMSGHYYIYSKLSVGCGDCLVAQQKNAQLIHSIWKRTPKYQADIVLLTNRISYCNRKHSEVWLHNSFLAGIVELEEKDQVYISVSAPHLVRVKDGTRCYFGTFMIW